MANCPKCRIEIGTSKYCDCGWRGRHKPADSTEMHADSFVQCAHETCNIPAFCKIHTKTGWANLCKKHYDFHYADEAHANLDKWGMARLPDESKGEHTARMREFVKTGFKRIVVGV